MLVAEVGALGVAVALLAERDRGRVGAGEARAAELVAAVGAVGLLVALVGLGDLGPVGAGEGVGQVDAVADLGEGPLGRVGDRRTGIEDRPVGVVVAGVEVPAAAGLALTVVEGVLVGELAGERFGGVVEVVEHDRDAVAQRRWQGRSIAVLDALVVAGLDQAAAVELVALADGVDPILVGLADRAELAFVGLAAARADEGGGEHERGQGNLGEVRGS